MPPPRPWPASRPDVKLSPPCSSQRGRRILPTNRRQFIGAPKPRSFLPRRRWQGEISCKQRRPANQHKDSHFRTAYRTLFASGVPNSLTVNDNRLEDRVRLERWQPRPGEVSNEMATASVAGRGHQRQ